MVIKERKELMNKEDVFLQKINKINTQGIGFRSLWQKDYRELVWELYVRAFTQTYGTNINKVSDLYRDEYKITYIPARFFSKECEDEFIGVVDFSVYDGKNEFNMWHILHPEYGVISMEDYHNRLPEEEVSIFDSVHYKLLIPNK